MRRLLEPMKVSDKIRNFVYVVIDHRRAHDLISQILTNQFVFISVHSWLKTYFLSVS